MNPNLKIFITIFCYISAVAGLATAVMDASHKPAQTTGAVIAGVLGVASRPPVPAVRPRTWTNA